MREIPGEEGLERPKQIRHALMGSRTRDQFLFWSAKAGSDRSSPSRFPHLELGIWSSELLAKSLFLWKWQ